MVSALVLIAFGFCIVSGQVSEDNEPLYRGGGFALAKQHESQHPYQKFGFELATQEAGIDKNSETELKEQVEDHLENRRLLLEYKGPFQGAPNSKPVPVICRRSNIKDGLDTNLQVETPALYIFPDVEEDVKFDADNENYVPRNKLPTHLEPEDLSERTNRRSFEPDVAESDIKIEELKVKSNNPVDTIKDKKDCDRKLGKTKRVNDETVDPLALNVYQKKKNEESDDMANNKQLKSKSGNPKSMANLFDDVQVGSSARQQKVMLIENTRVCYACSTASNPNCLVPNRRTTVKYCRKGHDTCITKVFEMKDTRVLTRDCGSSCNEGSLPGLSPKYSKCSVCHDDLCNGTYTINTQNLFLIFSVLFFTVIKGVF